MYLSDTLSTTNIVYLALGSNLGARYTLLCEAIDMLEQKVGVITDIAPFVETEPWGFVSPFPFLNSAVALRSRLSPYEVLAVTQDIERSLGRRHKHRPDEAYTNRTIDIDILFYGDTSVEDFPMLTIPHPLLHQRRFVLDPLVQIAPAFVHPLLHKTIHTLWRGLL